jgi:hypothetical protein
LVHRSTDQIGLIPPGNKKFDNNSKGIYTTHLHREIVALKFGQDDRKKLLTTIPISVILHSLIEKSIHKRIFEVG